MSSRCGRRERLVPVRRQPGHRRTSARSSAAASAPSAGPRAPAGVDQRAARLSSGKRPGCGTSVRCAAAATPPRRPACDQGSIAEVDQRLEARLARPGRPAALRIARRRAPATTSQLGAAQHAVRAVLLGQRRLAGAGVAVVVARAATSESTTSSAWRSPPRVEVPGSAGRRGSRWTSVVVAQLLVALRAARHEAGRSAVVRCAAVVGVPAGGRRCAAVRPPGRRCGSGVATVVRRCAVHRLARPAGGSAGQLVRLAGVAGRSRWW